MKQEKHSREVKVHGHLYAPREKKCLMTVSDFFFVSLTLKGLGWNENKKAIARWS